MQTPEWLPTTRTCERTKHDVAGVWTACRGTLLEWRQHHPRTCALTMTVWHCQWCDTVSFRAEPTPGSPAALAIAAGLRVSPSPTGA